MKKLIDKSGETLIEALTAILIMVLVFTAMTTALSTSAEINQKVRNTDNSFAYSEEEGSPISVEIKGESGFEPLRIEARLYSNNDYYYYEPPTGEE